MESFDRKSMMKTDGEGEKPAIDACRLQGTDDFLVNSLDNVLMLIESDSSQARPQHEIIVQVEEMLL